jgi:hypothetical protein
VFTQCAMSNSETENASGLSNRRRFVVKNGMVSCSAQPEHPPFYFPEVKTHTTNNTKDYWKVFLSYDPNYNIEFFIAQLFSIKIRHVVRKKFKKGSFCPKNGLFGFSDTLTSFNPTPI